MFYSSNEDWLGFLCEVVIRQCLQLSLLRCPGCEDGIKSSILHLHAQQSLLDKLKRYFEEVRGEILPTITELYEQFQSKLPHSDNLEKDKECYVSCARQFLLTITVESLYFGRYVNSFNDGVISEAFIIPKRSRKPNQKPVTKKQKKGHSAQSSVER